MVDFVSLFLGLFLGVVPVELTVGSSVTSVVVELDGQVVAELEGPPWSFELDLGAELEPHLVTARAMSAAGEELGKASRRLNVYRPSVGLGFALHRNSSGWVTMLSLDEGRLDALDVSRIAISIDGRKVEVEDRSKIWTPPLDPERLHVIEVVTELSDGRVSRDWIGVGGSALGDSSALVVPRVVQLDDGAPQPLLEDFEWVGPRPPTGRAVGIETGELEYVFVRDREARASLERLAPRPTTGGLTGGRDAYLARQIHAIAILLDEWVRVLDIDVQASDTSGIDLGDFSIAGPMSPGVFGLYFHLKNYSASTAPGSGTSGARLADAVAVAGHQAGASPRRRAVVLILGPRSEDSGSRLSPELARRYLDQLGVRLFVWYLGKPAQAPTEWGPVVPVRSMSGLKAAFGAARVALGGQRVVWVEDDLPF